MFKNKKRERKQRFYSHISKTVIKRYQTREIITWEEYQDMVLNSYERRLLHPLLSTEALIKTTEYALLQENQIELYQYSTPKHHKKAILKLHIHEILKRLKEKI